MAFKKEIDYNLDLLNFIASYHDMKVYFEYHNGINKYCLYRNINSDEPLITYETDNEMSAFLDGLELIRTGKI